MYRYKSFCRREVKAHADEEKKSGKKAAKRDRRKIRVIKEYRNGGRFEALSIKALQRQTGGYGGLYNLL